MQGNWWSKKFQNNTPQNEKTGNTFIVSVIASRLCLNHLEGLLARKFVFGTHSIPHSAPRQSINTHFNDGFGDDSDLTHPVTHVIKDPPSSNDFKSMTSREFQLERPESTFLQLITTVQSPKIPVRVNNKTSPSMMDVKRIRKNHHNFINTGCSFILFPDHLTLASPAHLIREPVTELLQVLHLISCEVSSKPGI